MANKFKFNLETINKDFAGKFTAFYELKKQAVKIRSEKSKVEHELAKIEGAINNIAAIEYPDMAKLKELEAAKTPLVEKVTSLAETLKAQNKAIKEHVETIIPPAMYESYALGVANSDFEAKTKEIKPFTVQVGLIASELEANNITDGACRRFAEEIKTHVGSKTTSGKKFLEGKLVEGMSVRAFNAHMVQVILEVLSMKYNVFSFDETKGSYIVNSNNNN